MAYTIKNNFQNFKSDFKKDTGLTVNADNMGKYIAYVHTRIADSQMQIMAAIVQELANMRNRP